MGRTILLWVLAVLITIGSAFYQRITGPTYPLSGSVEFADNTIDYNLERTHEGQTDQIVKIVVEDRSVEGVLEWKRYKTNDEWTRVQMTRRGDTLSAPLPGQPAAGKLEYAVILEKGDKSVVVPEDNSVVTRFKGTVPDWLIILHVLFIFGAMLLSTRAGLEVFQKEPQYKKFFNWTMIFLIPGGFILGPWVQLYAFDAWWTGVPFGWDLTDNKTLIALIAWLIAGYGIYKKEKPKVWVIGAALVMLIVFLIPHSVLGSELDYEELDKMKQQNEEQMITPEVPDDPKTPENPGTPEEPDAPGGDSSQSVEPVVPEVPEEPASKTPDELQHNI